MPIFISIGILIFFLKTLEFSSYPCKQWNSGPISISFGTVILFVQTLEFWPCFIHTGILTSSFETMVFWPYSYKHLPLILSFHCSNWNSCPILSNINLNSASIFIHIVILTSSFQTLQFWPHLYTHWTSYLIVLNLGIRALFLCTFTHWHFDLIIENIAILALSCYTLEFGSHPLKHWTSSLIFINIGILTISSKRWNSGLFFYKHWNSYLIHPQIGISGPVFYGLEFSPHPSEHLNSGPILTNIRIIILSFHCKYWHSGLTLPNNEFFPIIYTHWFFDLILQNTRILALFL